MRFIHLLIFFVSITVRAQYTAWNELPPHKGYYIGIGTPGNPVRYYTCVQDETKYLKVGVHRDELHEKGHYTIMVRNLKSWSEKVLRETFPADIPDSLYNHQYVDVSSFGMEAYLFYVDVSYYKKKGLRQSSHVNEEMKCARILAYDEFVPNDTLYCPSSPWPVVFFRSDYQPNNVLDTLEVSWFGSDTTYYFDNDTRRVTFLAKRKGMVYMLRYKDRTNWLRIGD